ncbi:MAG: hypothetical protein Q9195_000126 [Heterodermia aff. obscurata]
MAWRFWKYLQDFMAKYATNDLVERAFVVWALILAMLWGNNATFLFNPEAQSNLAIGIYLVWRGSVLLCEAYYAFFIHHIRNRIILQTLMIIPVLPLWIVADFYGIEIKAGLAFAAATLEAMAQTFINSPFITDRFLHADDRGEGFHADHWVERIGDFYIIILGEGVLSLIRGSPLEEGLTLHANGGVLALIAYYVLCGFYFNGDQSRRHIHAAKRATWWTKSLWLFFHTVLFGSTLILGVSVVFLIQHIKDSAVGSPETEGQRDESAIHQVTAIDAAKWTISVALSLALMNQTLIALLDRSMDPPGSLKINNRLLRLLPRILLIPILLSIDPVQETGLDSEVLGLPVNGLASTRQTDRKQFRSRNAPFAYPRKDSQDKDSINTEATEYSKSATDDESARQGNAAFDPNITDPHEQQGKAGEGRGDKTNPLEVSPANPEVSKQRSPQEGGAQNSGENSSRSRTSGGSSPNKGSKVA